MKTRRFGLVAGLAVSLTAGLGLLAYGHFTDESDLGMMKASSDAPAPISANAPMETSDSPPVPAEPKPPVAPPAASANREQSVGGPFALIDADGMPVTDQDFKGKWMLIYFGYTNCPDACPTALNDMALALDKIGDKRAKVQPIFITIDPERDTGAVLKDYVKAFGEDFIGLTGDQAALAAAKKAFRVYAKKEPHENDEGYEMAHSSIIYLMSDTGAFIKVFTHENPPEKIAETMMQRIP